MSELTPKPFSRRRLFLFGGLGAAACGATALICGTRPDSRARRALDSAGVNRTLLSFVGALFGRTLSPLDGADLSQRIAYLRNTDAALSHDCTVLAGHLDEQAGEWGAAGFDACSAGQKAAILDRIMRIDEKSKIARLLSHYSRSEREYYRMRWSAVPQLAWLYRHSPVAWRTRGYARWPGVRGDWHDVLSVGASYP
jgi:hypothetical protein